MNNAAYNIVTWSKKQIQQRQQAGFTDEIVPEPKSPEKMSVYGELTFNFPIDV